MRIEYTPRYLKDYADIKDARAKKETDKVERIIGAANNFMELHKMLDIKKYPDLGGYRIRYSGKPEWRIRFELVDDLQTKEKVVKLQIVLPREKYQKFAHKPVNESIEKNTKIIITEKQLTMLKNTKIIKLTESQLKDIVVQKIMEQSDWRDKVLYKQPNIKQQLGLEKPQDDTPFPIRRDWWQPINNITKGKDALGEDNTYLYFATPGGKYEANFEPKGRFYFSLTGDSEPIKNGEGKWAPNNQNGFTVTMNDGRILVYTPQGGKSPVSITGGKAQWKTPTVKTLDDIKVGKGYLAKGMKGPIVGELQKIMLELNMKISKTGKVDNLFGPIMDLSVRQFQATNMPTGSKDGKVGKDTLKRMIEIRDYDGSEEEPEVDDSGTNDTTQMTEV
jgi:hypothetical protein